MGDHVHSHPGISSTFRGPLYWLNSTVLVETVEYYVSNNSTIYGILIDGSKEFDGPCHLKLFELLETYNV